MNMHELIRATYGPGGTEEMLAKAMKADPLLRGGKLPIAAKHYSPKAVLFDEYTIPQGLPEPFTARDLMIWYGINQNAAYEHGRRWVTHGIAKRLDGRAVRWVRV